MTVKQNHQHVSQNGLCFLPYLYEWSERSTLVGLAEIASSVFSIEPPLFSKPAGAAAVTTQVTSSSSYAQLSSSGYNGQNSSKAVSMNPVPAVSGSSYGSADAYEAYATATSAVSSYGAARTSPAPSAGTGAGTGTGVTIIQSHLSSSRSPGNSSSDLRGEESRRLQLVDQVTMRLYEAVDDQQRALRDQMDALIAQGSALDQSAQAAERTIADLRQSKGLYTEAIAAMTEKNAAFEAWLSDEDAKPALPAVARLQPSDALSAQIVRLSAEVNAMDDAFYYLERALASSRNESVDIHTFLRECRSLARRQFLSKAHLRKITAQALQEEADRAALASVPVAQVLGGGGFPPQPLPPSQQQPQMWASASSAAAASAAFGPYSAVPYPVVGQH